MSLGEGEALGRADSFFQSAPETAEEKMLFTGVFKVLGFRVYWGV